jgi:hypothetical protein
MQTFPSSLGRTFDTTPRFTAFSNNSERDDKGLLLAQQMRNNTYSKSDRVVFVVQMTQVVTFLFITISLCCVFLKKITRYRIYAALKTGVPSGRW